MACCYFGEKALSDCHMPIGITLAVIPRRPLSGLALPRTEQGWLRLRYSLPLLSAGGIVSKSHRVEKSYFFFGRPLFLFGCTGIGVAPGPATYGVSSVVWYLPTDCSGPRTSLSLTFVGEIIVIGPLSPRKYFLADSL